MKKNLLSMMLCMPMMLAAQNGVTVSELAVNAGTVTFNVSWDRDAMPSLWSDSVWVFVDYNNASKMTRLPVTGIIASAGTATMTPGNDKGAWVIGNARSAGSFSATVTLLTATADIAGACAYASNYPPVGKYHNDYTEIVFTGTPMYDLVLEHTNGSTVTVQTGGTFLFPCDYTLTSFIDATTGAPGIVDCVPAAEGQAPHATCGCASDLTDCNGTCQVSCSAAFTTCNGFSQVSAVSYEGFTDRNGANTLCGNKGSGWRLPTLTELQCMCANKESLPGGYVGGVGGYYWTTTYYGDSYDNWYLVNLGDCGLNNDHYVYGYDRLVKCVK